MQKEYTREQLWKLFEKLPEELKEAIFSEETANNIWNICERNTIKEVSKVAKLVGDVLLGLLPPGDFQESLEKELKLEKEVAKKLSFETNRYIFRSVKETLRSLYEEEKPKKEEVPEKEEKKPKKKDIYREPIE